MIADSISKVFRLFPVEQWGIVNWFQPSEGNIPHGIAPDEQVVVVEVIVDEAGLAIVLAIWLEAAASWHVGNVAIFIALNVPRMLIVLVGDRASPLFYVNFEFWSLFWVNSKTTIIVKNIVLNSTKASVLSAHLSSCCTFTIACVSSPHTVFMSCDPITDGIIGHTEPEQTTLLQ